MGHSPLPSALSTARTYWLSLLLFLLFSALLQIFGRRRKVQIQIPERLLGQPLNPPFLRSAQGVVQVDRVLPHNLAELLAGVGVKPLALGHGQLRGRAAGQQQRRDGHCQNTL